jgi:hypothetical protein
MKNRGMVRLIVTLLSTLLVTPHLHAADAEVLFSRDIQPVLAKHCLSCHGPDKAEGGLRLDGADAAMAELDSGARAIVPAEPQSSELLRRISATDESERMPPEGDPLDPTSIANLSRWIENGAKYERHWAYRSVVKPMLPDVQDQAWIRNPIDRFVLSKLEAVPITPSPAADRATLIKRLYFDLLGLPPTPAEVDAFIADTSQEAYDKLVDKLLESQHFGERWGRHWLDKARYADSDGYEKDRPRPNAWRYRDWVIDAVNQDMPFDQFTIEQLAGDLLPSPSAMQLLATAFHRQTLTNTEGGTDQEQFRIEATFDRSETTAAVWMGLTMTCARCHNHKYDQITQREYYEFFAFFNDVNETNIDVAKSPAASATYAVAKEKHDEQVAALLVKYDERKSALTPQLDAWLAKMNEATATAEPVVFTPVVHVSAIAQGETTLAVQVDNSTLVTGPPADKDEYTLVFEAPKLPLTAIKVEMLTDESLPANGPGRAPNGNFVLSQLRSYMSDNVDFKENQRLAFTSADADFSQGKFAPAGALSDMEKSGWAISPQMGKPHEITFYLAEPLVTSKKYLQVVLDQQYGGAHTIGRFRISTVSGFDPLQALPKQVAKAFRTPTDQRSDADRDVLLSHVAAADPEAKKLETQLTKLRASGPPSPDLSVRVLSRSERPTKILHRGDFLQPSDDVQHGTLAVIAAVHPLGPKATAEKRTSRLDLARWLVDADHPLTSRVTVNHVWTRLFGNGIVPTVNDFGVRGELPTHPELLDWLAFQFPREMSWSRKQLIRTIVTSATYRQSSVHRADLASADPTNLWLARQNRVRVEAEIVRDLNLGVAGLLSLKVGGPSVFPPLPTGVAELSYANNFKWKTSSGEDRYRRGMYTFFKRTSPHPTLTSFDCPDSNTTNLQREVSNTPLQALATLNNDVFTEAAQAMVQRVVRESSQSDDASRLTFALRLCIARQPSANEIARFQQLLDKAREFYKQHPDDAKLLTARHTLDGVTMEEAAAWVATLRIVLNLDEFIVRG